MSECCQFPWMTNDPPRTKAEIITAIEVLWKRFIENPRAIYDAEAVAQRFVALFTELGKRAYWDEHWGIE